MDEFRLKVQCKCSMYTCFLHDATLKPACWRLRLKLPTSWRLMGAPIQDKHTGSLAFLQFWLHSLWCGVAVRPVPTMTVLGNAVCQNMLKLVVTCPILWTTHSCIVLKQLTPHVVKYLPYSHFGQRKMIFTHFKNQLIYFKFLTS